MGLEVVRGEEMKAGERDQARRYLEQAEHGLSAVAKGACQG